MTQSCMMSPPPPVRSMDIQEYATSIAATKPMPGTEMAPLEFCKRTGTGVSFGMIV